MIDHDVSCSTLKMLASQALSQYSSEALIAMLTDTDYVVRTIVARELQLRVDRQIFDYAVDISKAVRFEHREIAAFLLGQLGTPNYPYRNETIPLLIKLLTDDYYEVRGAAVAALGHLKALEAIDNILLIAFDESEYVRENVAFALTLIEPNKNSIAALKKLKNDPNEDVREWARYALKEWKL